jgi:hypothetical protein
MGDFPDVLLRRQARRLAGRPSFAGALIQEHTAVTTVTQAEWRREQIREDVFEN